MEYLVFCSLVTLVWVTGHITRTSRQKKENYNLANITSIKRSTGTRKNDKIFCEKLYLNFINLTLLFSIFSSFYFDIFLWNGNTYILKETKSHVGWGVRAVLNSLLFYSQNLNYDRGRFASFCNSQFLFYNFSLTSNTVFYNLGPLIIFELFPPSCFKAFYLKLTFNLNLLVVKSFEKNIFLN